MHLRCTQCSILLHLMDICFLTCICLWQISQIQTRLFIVGPGLVLTSPAFVRNSASHPECPHGRLVQTTVNRAPIAGGGNVRHNLPAVCDRCDSSTSCRMCRLEPSFCHGHLLCQSQVLPYPLLHSSYVLLGLPTGPVPSTINSIHLFTQSSSLFLITCPYRLLMESGADLAATDRIRNGWMKFRELLVFLTSRAPPLETKGRLYASCVRSSMTYRSETRPLLVDVGLKFERTRNEMQMIRWMCGISMKDTRKNEEMRRVVGVEPITTVMRSGRLRWYGHVMRTG